MKFATDSIWLRPFFVAVCLALIAGSFGCSGDNDSNSPPATATVVPTATAIPTVPPGGGGPAGAGVSSSITDVTIGSDPAGQVVATFTLTDDSGNPIEPSLSSTSDPQKGRVRFALAHVEEFSGGGEFVRNSFTRYVNDINETRPTYDSGGMLEALDASMGIYRYTFKTLLPEGYDPTVTYTVGMQVDRTFQGVQLSANPIFDFVPAGGVPQIRAGSATAQCNACHDPLQLHGNRREFRLCALCHTAAGVDEMGRSIDLKVMIHKIHRGKDLPSIVNGEPGATYGIYSGFARSDVVFARKEENGETTGVGFPRTLRDCETCHAGGETSHFYLTKPSTAACAACHDDVNPSLETTEAGPPGTGHFQSRGFADGDCTFCHTAEMEREFDVSVPGAHTIPERSAQLAGLNVDIVGVSSHEAGQTPAVSFKATDNSGTPMTDISGLNRLAFTFSGPTSDYQSLLTATAVGGGASGSLSGPDGDGVFTYMPAFAIPDTASGTWAVGTEARRPVQLEAPEGQTVSVNEAAVNSVVTFTVDDSSALVRRVVVEQTDCQRCHGEFSREFSIHGSLRNQIEYCVMCHNPDATDVSRRQLDAEAVARGEQTGNIDFKVMIHKIHTGEELENKPYVIYGFGSPFTPHDFAEVLFPGDRRNCEGCHAEGTHLIPPFPGSSVGTIVAHLDPGTGEEVVDGRLGPITSVCTSCHDGDAAWAHAETQTTSSGGEACSVCHMEGRDVPVSEAHAR